MKSESLKTFFQNEARNRHLARISEEMDCSSEEQETPVGSGWEVVPSLPLVQIFSHLKNCDR